MEASYRKIGEGSRFKGSKVQGSGFRVQRFRVQRFKVQRFKVQSFPSTLWRTSVFVKTSTRQAGAAGRVQGIKYRFQVSGFGCQERTAFKDPRVNAPEAHKFSSGFAL
jgi:hypothetical protein